MKLTRKMTLALMLALMGLMSLSTSFKARANGPELDWMHEALSSQITYHMLSAQQTPTIACDETKQGSIAQSDQTLQDGTHYDLYAFATQQPNQPVIVTFQSAAFAGTAELYVANQQGQLQFFSGTSGIKNARLQLSTVLATPGQYVIAVYPIDSAQSLGDYSVKLECKACGATTPPPAADCSTGGTPDNPIAISVGQTFNCQLTANDARLTAGGQTFYSKFFAVQTQGGNVTINAQSTAFNATLLIIDPPGSQPGIYVLNNNPSTLQLPAGRYVIGVTTKVPDQPQRTGAFTFQVSSN